MELKLKVGVKVLLKNPDGKILLLKRSEEKYGKTNGQWDMPGGRINVGSTLMDNLQREVTEETQLTITSKPRLIAAQDILAWENTHTVRITYTGTTEGEPILDTTENTDFRWVTFTELKAEDYLDIYLKQLLTDGVLTENSW